MPTLNNLAPKGLSVDTPADKSLHTELAESI